jgi:hypothetical protein
MSPINIAGGVGMTGMISKYFSQLSYGLHPSGENFSCTCIYYRFHILPGSMAWRHTDIAKPWQGCLRIVTSEQGIEAVNPFDAGRQ